MPGLTPANEFAFPVQHRFPYVNYNQRVVKGFLS